MIVWGRLRGVVHAGAKGNRSAVVCALDLSPTQLRIAGTIALTPTREGKPQPEIVRLNENQLQAEPWAILAGDSTVISPTLLSFRYPDVLPMFESRITAA